MPYGWAAPPKSWLALTGAIYAFGVAVRIAWAEHAQPWVYAPDHLAWGLLLHEALAGPVRTDQIFHFPHEGWSVVNGVLALVIARVSAIDPAEALAWAALIVDSLGRAIETLVVAALFGLRAALGFTVWSAVGNLLLIQNASAAYGGHLALSPWPLVALAIVLHPPGTRAGAIAAGAVLGLSAAIGNQDLILVVVVLSMIGRTGLGATLAVTTFGTAAALLVLRTRFDLGFHLVGFDWWNIRGMALRPEGTPDVIEALSEVTLGLLPASFALGARGVVVAAVVLWTGAGIALLRSPTSAKFVGAVGGLFVSMYAFLFAHELPHRPFDAIDLRHMAWLAPVLAAVAIAGWARVGRWGWATVLLPVAAAASAIRTATPRTGEPAWYGAGFTLAAKLGDDPPRLDALARWVPSDRRATFWSSVGAGLGEAALQDPHAAQRAADLVDTFPLERRPEIAEGTERRLFQSNPATQAQFAAAVWSGQVVRTGQVAPLPRSGLLLFGASTLTLPDTADTGLVVLATGELAAGEGPLLELWVGEDLVKTVPIGTEIRSYDLGPVPPHARLQLRYRNDFVDAEGNDRNLVIHWIDRQP